jgi:hypothetical protein
LRRHLLRAQKKTVLTTAILALAWTGAIAVGLRALVKYESTPGAVGAVPQTWPAQSKIQRALDRPTLVMLAHPRCPCTGASVNELAQVLAQTRRKARAFVVFMQPAGSSDWDDTALRRSAAAIPGVTVLSDPDGAEAQLFGAETSGQTLLFTPQGRLVFSGGITGSRGHSGDNVGESALVSLINGQSVNRSQTLVFGCSLKGRNQKGNQMRCPR